MIGWRKLGRIFEGAQGQSWATDFAAVPTVSHVGGDIYHVIFSARDAQQHSLPGWFEFDIKTHKVTRVGSQPILPLGDLGCFDDGGVMPTWQLKQDDGDLLYYIGWNQGVSVPFRNSLGVAKQQQDGSWQKLFPGPIVDRSRDEPHFVASCAVERDDDVYHCWYLSCTGWEMGEDGPVHKYHIKYASSEDGLSWARDGHVAIDYATGEYAISRPSVLRDESGLWHMWFSARGEHYQIFHATSHNAWDWQREQAPVLMASENGWDSDMVCYPHVIQHEQQLFMFYNGNAYGRTGIGLAIWEG